jgi:hypothetical protein
MLMNTVLQGPHQQSCSFISLELLHERDMKKLRPDLSGSAPKQPLLFYLLAVTLVPFHRGWLRVEFLRR